MKKKKHKNKKQKKQNEPKKYKKSFIIPVIAVINLVIILLLELGLRIFGVGIDPSLVYKAEVGKENYLYFNKLYTYKFCPAVMPTIPAPHLELFKEKKDPGVYRIFVIGESTSRGFPYTKIQSFPGQLLEILKHATRQKKFEVINISIAATNSHIGVDVVDQVVQYHPDLAIIYYGHNEFIGIGGSGKNRNILYKLNHILYKSRIYQSIKLLIFNASEKGTESLLEHMSGDLKVKYNSRVYHNTIANFKDCYEEIIQTLQEHNVTVITCGVAKNLKDFSPLNSVKPSQKDIDRIHSAVETGTLKDFSRVLDELTENNRNIAFDTGRMLLAEQKRDHALICFNKSCDLDEARLRAPTEINTVIKNLSEKHNCIYIDIQSYLNQYDTDNISGNGIFLEHVHTTLRGHSLISRKLGEIILNKIIKTGPDTEIKNRPVYSSIIDHIAVCKTLKNLYTRYPLRDYKYFNATGFKNIYTVNTDSLDGLSFINEDIAKEYAYLEPYFNKFNKINELHFAVGVDYFKQGQYNKAYREFALAFALNPMYSSALNNMAIMKYFSGDAKTSGDMLKHLYRLNPNYNIGLLNLWLYNKLEKNDYELAGLEEEMDNKKVDYHTITQFTLDTGI